jgi:hypothetical protein
MDARQNEERVAAAGEGQEGHPEERNTDSLSLVPMELMPKLLRLSDLRESQRLDSHVDASTRKHRTYTIAEHAAGLLVWSSSLEKGVLPLELEDSVDAQGEEGSPSFLSWPCEPLRALLLGAFARLKLATFCSRFPTIHKACLSAILDVVIAFETNMQQRSSSQKDTEEKTERSGSASPITETPSSPVAGATDNDKDSKNEKYQKWLAAKEAKKAGASNSTSSSSASSGSSAESSKKSDPKYQKWLAAKRAKQGGNLSQQQPLDKLAGGGGVKTGEEEDDDNSEDDGGNQWWSGITDLTAEDQQKDEFRGALEVVNTFYFTWEPAIGALSKASSTFNFVDMLLGKGDTFNVDDQNSVWRRKGWDKLDGYRQNLEKCKPLRDLVRTLGRGAGWGPLRRSPVQSLDMVHGREGLLRSILEQQETRGLCRSDDLARMLPSEACMLAKGRTQPVAKRLFFAKFVQQSLLSYERDGWHVQPTRVPNPLIREVRPTADRGPILLCIDTSGSMRGVREQVAKALTLECMRAAKEQERGCFVYCFSGPSDVRELELSVDAEGSIDRLLSFLEKVFNGGSDLNEPMKRCMDKLHKAEWSNSDVLIVSDGELRCPQEALMKQLVGAKDKWNLRVHGVVLPASQVIRAKKSDKNEDADADDAAARKKKSNDDEEQDGVDIGVLRNLCTNPTRGGKDEVCVHVFKDWGAFSTDVFAEEELAIQGAVNKGKLVEEWRQKEIERLQEQQKQQQGKGKDRKLRAHPGMKYDKAQKTKDRNDKKLKAFPGMAKKY